MHIALITFAVLACYAAVNGVPAALWAQSPPAATAWKAKFRGVDGKYLPFTAEEELLEFLRTAEVVQKKGIPRGITAPQRITLEKNGIRAQAAFRYVDASGGEVIQAAGTRDPLARDSFLFEPAAYELARMLGIDNIPPAVERKVDGQRGSVQIWVENAMTQDERIKKKLSPPDPLRWSRQIQIMRVFDALIYNIDRNTGNIIIDPEWNLWMIDHTRGFRRDPNLQDARMIAQCEKRVYQRLLQLDEATARERLGKYLSKMELDTLLARRQKLLEHLQALIASQGESEVLFTFYEEIPAAAANP